jgi:hypothetical protein
MQNDMLSYYLAQVKCVVRAYAYLSALLEAVRTASLREPRLRMKLFLYLEVHVLAVLIEATHAREHDVCGAAARHGESAARVCERHGARHETRLRAVQHLLDAARQARADRLLEEGADIEADIQRTAAERFHGEHLFTGGKVHQNRPQAQTWPAFVGLRPVL